MDVPSGATENQPHDDETRWASFSPGEARLLLEIKARYDAGEFAEDSPSCSRELKNQIYEASISEDAIGLLTLDWHRAKLQYLRRFCEVDNDEDAIEALQASLLCEVMQALADTFGVTDGSLPNDSAP